MKSWPKQSSWSQYDKYSIVKNLWWIYLPNTRDYFSVMFRKWKVPLTMEKNQCVWFLSSKKNKKNIKQEVKNYRRISLLSVSSKIFERLLYESIFKLFTEPSLISQNQSGFKQADSCTVTSSCQLRIKSTNLLMTVMKFDLCS